MVYAYDMRGHGASPGARGHVQRWQQLRADLGAFIAHVREREGVRRVSLLGHGLGALLALDYALFEPRQLRAVAALSPPSRGH